MIKKGKEKNFEPRGKRKHERKRRANCRSFVSTILLLFSETRRHHNGYLVFNIRDLDLVHERNFPHAKAVELERRKNKRTEEIENAMQWNTKFTGQKIFGLHIPTLFLIKMLKICYYKNRLSI